MPRPRGLQSLAFLLLSLVLLPTLALSQPSAPALVRDINPGLNPEERTGEPQLFVEMGGIVYFYNYDPAHGEELWRTDGTEEGTWLLKDIVPGPVGSSPEPFAIGDTLYLWTSDGRGGRSLWQSDGTAAGTVPLLPGYEGPLPPLRGGTAFSFQGCRETGPCELWKSESMTSGTVKVATLTPPPGAFGVQPVAGSEGSPFFFKFSSQDGRMHEIWRSDGTEAGTFPLRRFNVPGGFSTLFLFFRSGGTLFFDGWDETWGRALWTSDGTVEGTARLKDVDPGGFKEIDGILYFAGRDDASGWELWRSDGTEVGTVLVKDIVPGPGSSFATLLGKVGGAPLVLTWNPQTGYELWKTDGSEEGTLLVKDIVPGPDDFIDWPTVVDGVLFFMIDDGVHGIELWKSDGTAEGTTLVKDIVPGPGSFGIMAPDGGAGKLYFWGFDGVSGHELWVSDGTEEGTFPLKDLVKATSSVPHQLAALEDHLFFTATDGSQGYQLWKTDGTAEGTVPAHAFEAAPANAHPQVSAGELDFYTTIDPASFVYSLWRSDGTSGGTFPVASWSPGDVPRGLTVVDGTLYLGLVLHAGGQELWKSDGTQASTVRIRRVSDSRSPLGELTSVQGRLYFTAEDAAGRELWKSDGTEAGTLRVKDIFPGPQGSHPGGLAVAGDRLAFAATDPAQGREVWVSDGTAGGTFPVGDVAPGARSSWPDELTFWNGKIFFSADDGATGIELWSFELVPTDTTPVIEDLVVDTGPVPVGTPVQAAVSFFDPDPGQSHTVVWDWGDGTETGEELPPGHFGGAGATHVYSAPGFYTVTVRVIDSTHRSAVSSYEPPVIVYDPNGPSVRGAGWFPLTQGKATFQLDVGYGDGGHLPEGRAQLKAPGVDFRAVSFDLLVVQGPTAWLIGEGTVNGRRGYPFWILLTDGQADGGDGADRVRFRIWEWGGSQPVFDNEPGRPLFDPPATPLGGGTVQIREKGKRDRG